MANGVGSLFWNTQERRLRAFWRLVLQSLLFFVLIAVMGIISFIPAALMAGVETLDPSDPTLNQRLNQIIRETPLLLVFSILVTLLATVISVWVAGRFLDRRRFVEFGMHLDRRWWRDLVFGMVLGAVLMLLVFLVELQAGWVTIAGTYFTPQGAFPVAIVIALLAFTGVGIQEELLTRGYHLVNISEGMNHSRWSSRAALLAGYLGSSIIFGLLHASNPNSSVISTINLMLAGLLLGLGFVLTGQLAIPIGLHITWNFFQGNVFGFPVSGTMAGPTFYAIEQGGPEVWTGGAFGPEAGLVGLFAMLLGMLSIYGWVRLTAGKAELQTHLAEYENRDDKT